MESHNSSSVCWGDTFLCTVFFTLGFDSGSVTLCLSCHPSTVLEPNRAHKIAGLDSSVLEGKQMPRHSPSETVVTALSSGITCVLNTDCSPPAAAQPGQEDLHYTAPGAVGTLGAVC